MKRVLVKYRYRLLLLSVLAIGYYFCLPKTLFDTPYSTILNDQEGRLLSAKIADDGQWRFPEIQEVPTKYEAALLTFEDQHFYRHPGVNPFALGRAVIQNIRNGRVVSGGSTISMQVIRLARKGKSRNAWQKLVEMTLATRLELRYSKGEILKMYASQAPFGGNVVGLDAAAWRYYGRSADQLSWSEAALLAVLPNQPSLLFPGRNEAILKAKRDRLLTRLHEEGHFDAITLQLAMSEELPLKPAPLPMEASHLLNRSVSEGRRGEVIESTLDRNLQRRVGRVLQNHHIIQRSNEVYNLAAIVLDVKTGEVKAYHGNVPQKAERDHGYQVDVIRAPRSTGSILKPLLYASLLDEGMMLPNTLLPDVPVFFQGFAPENYTRTYDGAVHAKMALARSLNIPAVHMLKKYGYPRFHDKLKKLGMTTLTRPADHYGLSLILGGAEGSLWDMASIYAGLSRTLQRFPKNDPNARYGLEDFRPPSYVKSESSQEDEFDKTGTLSAASIWFTLDAMLEVYRPDEEANWKMFSSSRKIAWKTGTSFGHRDAWSVGVTPDHVVAVWVGNADGEGRPGLTGISAAAPVMFDVFDLLPESTWFAPPMPEMTLAAVDRQSGHLASPYSIEVDTTYIPSVGVRTGISPYHQKVHLDPSGEYRVNSDCESVLDMEHQNWFILPPKQAVYFKKKNPTYRELPPLRNDCYSEGVTLAAMDILYPEPNAEVYLPVDLSGEKGEVVLEVVHRNPNSLLHWHLDELYLGTTLGTHTMAVLPAPGQHTITVVDSDGNEVKRRFEVLKKVTD